MADTLSRLRSVDWMGKSEATISSQLIMPVLMLLGYGEHTLHKVAEQQSYSLRDPYIAKGSRRIRLDYEPRVYEEGLWVMEAKGTDEAVDETTLGQVRDYAIHPEVRAALMVTVDAAGFRVFDPWDEHWDEPLLTIGVNEVADRMNELRAVLGVDRVADVIRRRHLGHLRKALSASLEFNALADADREFREILREAQATISERRQAIHRKAREDADALHERVVRQSGVWGVAQENNKPWPGRYADFRDYATAVLAQDERQRPTQILQFVHARPSTGPTSQQTLRRTARCGGCRSSCSAGASACAVRRGASHTRQTSHQAWSVTVCSISRTIHLPQLRGATSG